ncbi:MAG TPA: thiamine pyrophosphate-dependent enzyme [Methylomirabilota bacterium]|nr:thiamine pyrophosphate-dependent enzyme [Methylomirabilota bacterium]
MSDPVASRPVIVHETPSPMAASPAVWGSDAIAACLRTLDIPYLALNPGASYRGLHDSLVNYLGNSRPQMLLAIHEEAAVTMAHGYAKVAERMMGAVVHSNVGLMHATMAIFNAWCDRQPVLILGATGPWDAARRRPWIDWIHTAADQGALVRDYTKWDNQPASVPAACEALMRAAQLANTPPRGPVYVNLDAGLQETRIDALPPMPEASRHRAPESPRPAPELVTEAARLLSAARRPVILVGRSRRSELAWKARVTLAEALNASVITDLKLAAAFPTDHPLHVAPPGSFPHTRAQAALREADVVLSLDWTDLAGTLKTAFGGERVSAKVVNVSLDAHAHRGWSMDHQGLPVADVYLLCEPDAALPALIDAVSPRRVERPSGPSYEEARPIDDEALSLQALAGVFNEAARGISVSLTRVPLGWHGSYRHFRHPLDYIGADGGAGVGSGPGITVGAALALKGSGRVPVALMGDGDFLMSVTALWTATHYQIPCLIVVCNNRAFYNDELHQERVARERGRPVENKWIGQRLADPDIDLAAIARAQGAEGIGPVTRPAEAGKAIAQGLAMVQQGAVCVIDARVLPGYGTDMSGTPSPRRR